MSEFVILLGGDIAVTERLRDQVRGRKVIAADSGIRHAKALGLEVDLWVGDFDSVSTADSAYFAHVRREEWPAAKNLTDGEIAINAAKERSAKSIVVVGAFGGRTAHASNHLLMLFGFDGDIILTSGEEEAMPIRSDISPKWPAETVFSILAFDDLDDVTVTGARWPLENVSVQSGSGWTLSNVTTGDLLVSVGSGRAVLLGELPRNPANDKQT